MNRGTEGSYVCVSLMRKNSESKANDGAEVVNGVAGRVRAELFCNMGFGDLLDRRALTGRHPTLVARGALLMQISPLESSPALLQSPDDTQ